jgi:hypothetical protein
LGLIKAQILIGKKERIQLNNKLITTDNSKGNFG